MRRWHGVGAVLLIGIAAATATWGPALTQVKAQTPVAAGTFGHLQSQMGLATGVDLVAMSDSQLAAEFDGFKALNVKWIRTLVSWQAIQSNGPGNENWHTLDRMETLAKVDGMAFILQVNTPPAAAWAKTPDSDLRCASDGTPPFSFKAYAAFAAAVAARDPGSVLEIGNEPNLAGADEWLHPSACQYTQLLQESYTAVKHADHTAFVLSAGIGGTSGHNGDIPGATFIGQMYTKGAKGFFDALAYHPYSYPCLLSQTALGTCTGDKTGRGWPGLQSARDTMVANGDSAKQIWLTEFGAPADGGINYTDQSQAAILLDGYEYWSSISWAGPMMWFTYRDKAVHTTDHKGYLGLVTADYNAATSAGHRKLGWLAYWVLSHEPAGTRVPVPGTAGNDSWDGGVARGPGHAADSGGRQVNRASDIASAERVASATRFSFDSAQATGCPVATSAARARCARRVLSRASMRMRRAGGVRSSLARSESARSSTASLAM